MLAVDTFGINKASVLLVSATKAVAFSVRTDGLSPYSPPEKLLYDSHRSKT